jgi:hypothetical protein
VSFTGCLPEDGGTGCSQTCCQLWPVMANSVSPEDWWVTQTALCPHVPSVQGK